MVKGICREREKSRISNLNLENLPKFAKTFQEILSIEKPLRLSPSRFENNLFNIFSLDKTRHDSLDNTFPVH